MPLWPVLVALGLALLTAGSAEARSNPTFVPLTPATGALYHPDSGPAPRVGLAVMRRTANSLTHPACTACETTPGQYANSARNFFDHVRDWINARF